MSRGPAVIRHFTASAFVVWDGRVLLLLHRQKRLWLPPGGHVEPDETPAATARREVREETGLSVQITSPRHPPGQAHAAPRPEASLEVEVEAGHVHLDLVYFARPAPASNPEALHPNEEAEALRWWAAEELRRFTLSPPPFGGALPNDVAALAQQALGRATR